MLNKGKKKDSTRRQNRKDHSHARKNTGRPNYRRTITGKTFRCTEEQKRTTRKDDRIWNKRRYFEVAEPMVQRRPEKYQIFP